MSKSNQAVYVKPTNVKQLDDMIAAGYVEVFEGEAIPPTVQATLAEYEDSRADQRVFRFTEENKFGFVLRCLDCNSTDRVIRTSDAFQVKRCLGCTAKTRRSRAKERREEAKAALAAAKKTEG